MLKGWVDLTSEKPHLVKKSIKYLEQGIQSNKDVLGLMGKVGRGDTRGKGPRAEPLATEMSRQFQWRRKRGPERVSNQPKLTQ